MSDRFTTMTVGDHRFAFDFDTGDVQLSWAGSHMVLPRDKAFALRDFLVEVLSTQEQPGPKRKQPESEPRLYTEKPWLPIQPGEEF